MPTFSVHVHGVTDHQIPATASHKVGNTQQVTHAL